MSALEGPLYCAIAGGILAYRTGRQVWLGYASQRWPHAVGKILTASTSIDATDVQADPPAPAEAAWIAEFIYQYTVNGHLYRGSRLRFTPFSFREAKRAAARFQSGHGVRIAYSPSDPKLCLEPGVTIWGVGAFAAAAVITLAGLCWLGATLLQ